jgi:6-phosphofructokinase 1
MVAVHGETTKTVSLKEVVGRKKLVPLDHQWIRAARNVGTCLGD